MELGRPKPRHMFLSYTTGKPLSRSTIAKYILDLLSLAGIDVNCFRAHSARGCAPSFQASKGSSPGSLWVSLKGIIIGSQIPLWRVD